MERPQRALPQKADVPVSTSDSSSKVIPIVPAATEAADEVMVSLYEKSKKKKTTETKINSQ